MAPLVTQLHSYVEGLALKVFESPKFAQLWDALNRHSHAAVINTLTGKQTPAQQKLAKARCDRDQRLTCAQPGDL